MISSRSSLVAMLALGAVVSIADVGFAQPGGRGGGRDIWGGGANLSTLLRDPKVQQELELVDDQLADLEDVQRDMRDQMMEMFRGGGGFRDLADDERRQRMEEMRTKVTEKMKEVDAELGDILLPHQLDRLKQLRFQSQIQRGGTTGMADNDTIVEALGISPEQQEKMKEAAEKAAKKLEEKIAQLRQQAQDEILAVLSSDQRAKFKELQGESFEFDNNRRRGADIGQRGGRGDNGDANPRNRRRGGEPTPAPGSPPRSDF